MYLFRFSLFPIIARMLSILSVLIVFTLPCQALDFELTESEKVWLKGHPLIRVQNELDSTPYNFNDGTPVGFSIDYMNLLAGKLGIQVDYITGPSWNEFLGMIKTKQLDVMLNIVNTEERRGFISSCETLTSCL